MKDDYFCDPHPAARKIHPNIPKYFQGLGGYILNVSILRSSLP